MDAYGALRYLMTRADFVSRGVMFRAASALRLRIRLPAPSVFLNQFADPYDHANALF
jgi:hypothetical protein